MESDLYNRNRTESTDCGSEADEQLTQKLRLGIAGLRDFFIEKHRPIFCIWKLLYCDVVL